MIQARPTSRLSRYCGVVKGRLAKAIGSTAKIAQGIKRRSCKYSALWPRPWDMLT